MNRWSLVRAVGRVMREACALEEMGDALVEMTLERDRWMNRHEAMGERIVYADRCRRIAESREQALLQERIELYAQIDALRRTP